MKELENIIQVGKKMGGTRGGEIQLEGNNIYLTNVKRSSLYHFNIDADLGTGTFYANQAPMNAEEITRRDDKVLFKWVEKGVKRTSFIPNLDSFKTDFEKRFAKDYVAKKVSIPKKIFDVLQDILITKLKIQNNHLIINQTRSDGYIGFKNEISLSTGLIKAEIPDTEEISIFTSDLTILSLIAGDSIGFGFNGQKPLSVSVSFPYGRVMALIGTLEYD